MRRLTAIRPALAQFGENPRQIVVSATPELKGASYRFKPLIDFEPSADKASSPIDRQTFQARGGLRAFMNFALFERL